MVRCSNQTQLVVRCLNWFISYFLFSLYLTHQISSSSSPSPPWRWSFTASPQLRLHYLSYPTIQALKTAPKHSTAPRRQTITPAKTNRRARAPLVVEILSECIRRVRFEVLYSTTISTSSAWVSWSLDNLAPVKCTYSHLRDFRNQPQQSDSN